MKKILLLCGTILTAFLVWELGFWGFYVLSHHKNPRIHFRDMMSVAYDYPAMTVQIKAKEDFVDPYGTQVIHPYFGFVFFPEDVPASSPYGIGQGIDLTTLSENDFVVGIFGGSFADGIYVEAVKNVDKLIPKQVIPKGKKARVVNFALGGYKQPQQLMVLAYFLSMGTKFDLIINIDGFNEVVLPVAENIPRNVNYSFPRSWDLRVSNVQGLPLARVIGKIVFWENARKKWVGLFLRSWLRNSLTVDLIWKGGDGYFARALARTQEELQKTQTEPQGALVFMAKGPKNPDIGEKEMVGKLADLWEKGSQNLAAICRGLQIPYFHILQPNQYVPSSKTFSREERLQAYNENHPYKRGVIIGYPELIKRGRELRKRGIHFLDLTQVFVDVRETVWTDDCCHLNPHGSDIVIAKISSFIDRELRLTPW